MLKGEKGVTRIVLAVGIIITIILVLVIGIYLLSPVVEKSPAFVVKDIALYSNTIMAAPEDVTVTLDLPAAVLIDVFYGDICIGGVCTSLVGNKKIERAVAIAGVQKTITITKTYDGYTGKNKIKWE